MENCELKFNFVVRRYFSVSSGSGSGTDQWSKIDWRKAEQDVARKQTKILEEFRNGNKDGALHLQKELIQLFAARACAVRQVTRNRGKNTPGVDGDLWKADYEKWKAIGNLIVSPAEYKASPVRRIWISKDGNPLKEDNSNGRPLGIPTMYDRAYQALWKMALDPIAEELADHRSFGFRKGRSTHNAIVETVEALKIVGGLIRRKWILEGDIAKCFDRISHAWILENIPMDKSVLGQFLEAGHLEYRDVWVEAFEGVPQGGIISPTISNMVLDGMQKVCDKLTASNPKAVGEGIVIRYADDFVVVTDSEASANAFIEPITEFLKIRGLALSETKTSVTSIYKGFDFLGVNMKALVRKNASTGVPFVSRINIEPTLKANRRLKAAITESFADQNATAADIIIKINPILRGWGVYYAPIVSIKKPIVDMDTFAWQAAFNWLVRKYSRVGRKEIYRTYMMPLEKGSTTYMLFAQIEDKVIVMHKMMMSGAVIKRAKALPEKGKNIYDINSK